MRLGRVHQIHLVGIGGTGMCGIAEVLIREGFRVSGSDMASTPTTQRLRILGCQIYMGHLAENVGTADVLVYSSAVPAGNPELVWARSQGIPVIRRGEMLAELMRMKVGIAIAGAHGKTTTTTMTGYVLNEAGMDPTVVVGGRILGVDGNTIPGRSENMVAEADESDGSFLLLNHAFAIVTNVDEEHLDFYGSYADLEEAFVQFMNRVPFWGAIVACSDDERLAKLLPKVNRRVITYGMNSAADLTGRVTARTADSTSIHVHSATLDFELDIPVPGLHNAVNALGAAALALELGASPDAIRAGMSRFGGIHRRLERKLTLPNLVIYDDYGHHPTEIARTIEALQDLNQGQLWVVFQPHRYTRTHNVWKQFAAAFKGVDHLWITEIYAAGEEPIEGINGITLVQALRQAGIPAEYMPVLDMQTVLAANPTGILLTLGAGSITGLAEDLVNELA